MSTFATRLRLGALALSIGGVLFLLYPVTRPWHDESTVDGALAAMSSDWWVASHLFAMFGFILVSLGLLALWGAVRRTPAEPVALAAVVTSWIGAGLTLSYYGAEDYALHTLARKVEAGEDIDIVALSDAIGYQPAAVTVFGLGLILLAVAGVLAAIAIWRSGVLPRFSGIPFAAGYVLFLPQFFTPPASRIAHGVLMAVGLIWMAVVVWKVREQD
jgi:hypothetical protein